MSNNSNDCKKGEDGMNQIVDFFNKQPEQIKSSIAIVFVLCLVCVIVGQKIKKINPVDKTPLWLVPFIMIVETINDFVKKNIGKRWKSYAPYILTLALFLFFANSAAIWGITPPTNYISINAALAFITFMMIQITGIRSLSLKGYLKGFLDPFPLFLPINIVSEISLPISMTLRLFGSILSGGVLSLILTGFLDWASILVLPAFNLIFDIAFGLIQTLVFVLLTVIFTSMKVDETEKIY